jgi:hypothetical protein
LKWLNLWKQYIFFFKKCDRESVWDHSWCKCKKRPGFFVLKLILDKWFLLIVSLTWRLND